MSGLRDPARREHFVYRAYDTADTLLYLGCTARLDERRKAHRNQSDWYERMVRTTLSGPYNYDTARQLEREGLKAERPLYAFHPDRRTILAAHSRIYERHFAIVTRLGMGFWAAHRAAKERADAAIPCEGNTYPWLITDLTVAAALRADREDQVATFEEAKARAKATP